MISLAATIGMRTSGSCTRMEEEKIVEKLSEKSKSLRRTSLKKRLQTEIKKENPTLKEKITKKRKLSKYRRKTANAKERERMKRMNDVFATLKSVIPASKKDDQEETKVTTLRSAIAYINNLKQLIKECDAGLVDKTECNVKHDKEIINKTHEYPKKMKTPKKKSKCVKSVVKCSKPIILDANWTNYSPQSLQNKSLMSKRQNKLDTSYQNIVLQPLPDITTFSQIKYHTFSPLDTSCSSPEDMNSVSLHISLLDSQDEIGTLEEQDQFLLV